MKKEQKNIFDLYDDPDREIPYYQWTRVPDEDSMFHNGKEKIPDKDSLFYKQYLAGLRSKNRI